MSEKIVFLLLIALLLPTAYCKDIDVEQYVKKYWKTYHNKAIEIGNGDKRWPLTPELKAERLRHFHAMFERFAPHLVKEAEKIEEKAKEKGKLKPRLSVFASVYLFLR